MDKINFKQTNEYYYTYTLENGLTVYFYNNKNVKNFYMALTTKYGSNDIKFKFKDEEEYRTVPCGLAHFLEHITFHLEGKEADELFKPYGAYINAFTNNVGTSYIVGGNNSFDKCLDNLLYYVYTPYYTDETVENEKGIIIEEAKRNLDNPDREFYITKLRTVFSKLNCRNEVVGKIEDIESISLKNINDAYDVFYHPSNMFLVISGNFDIDEAKDIIEKRMNTFSFKDKKEYEVVVPEEPFEVAKDYHEYKGNVLNDKVSYLIKIPANNIEKTGLTKQEYELYLSLIMQDIFGHTSKCYQELLDNDIVNFASSIGVVDYDNYYVISINNSPLDDRIKAFTDTIEKYFSNITINYNDIKRKINSYKSSYILSFDDNEEITNSFIDDVLSFGTPVDNFIEILDDFTVEKGNKIIENIDFSNKSIVILQKKEDN